MELTSVQRSMPFFPPPCFTLRSRREVNTHDQVNSLHVEQWQTDGPFLQYNRPDTKGQQYFMDMNPINSRTTDRNYIQNQPYEAGNGSQKQLGTNPYFDKFDVQTDPFNVARELRATVYEDKVDRGLLESKRLLNRTYTTRWLPEDYAAKKNLDSLQAYENLRPQFNNMEKTYRPSNQTAAQSQHYASA
jgi:hypothetical protein